MALIAAYLIDSSAAARMRHPPVAARLAPLIESGVVATTAVLDAESLYSTRSSEEYERVRADRRAAYEYIPTDDEHWQAALEAQRALAAGSRHRAVAMPDLLTAVVASAHRLTVIHYDSNFEIAAEVIEFEHRWVLPRGAV